MNRVRTRGLRPARGARGDRPDDARAGLPRYRGFFCDPWPAERMHLYTCTDFSGVMTDCDEGCLEWVDKAAVQDLPIWQGDKIFFKLLAEDAPFFHLELTYDGDVLVKAVLDGVSLAL